MTVLTKISKRMLEASLKDKKLSVDARFFLVISSSLKLVHSVWFHDTFGVCSLSRSNKDLLRRELHALRELLYCLKLA